MKTGKLEMNRLAHATTKLAAVVLMCATFSPPANARPPIPNGTVVSEWNENAITAITVDNGYANPLQGTRVLTMVHVAIHDAVNGAIPQYERYEFTGHDPHANPTAAAAAAAHRVLSRLFPAQQTDLDARLSDSLHRLPNGSRERRGIELGREAADAIWSLRLNDGSDQFGEYTPGTAPGRWQYTPPYDGINSFIFVPAWRFVTTWALDRADQFRVRRAPPALSSAQYAREYNEVKTIGHINSATRTPEQTAYGKFWYEFSDIGWNRITRIVSASHDLDLAQSARLFALVNITLADSWIAGWDSKFYYDFWRPITAIRAGDTDGNPATEADATWEPLMPTPPIQDYPSTHSVLGDGAAEILGSILGDETAFATTSSTAIHPNVEVRSFSSFTQAADENGDSRVQVGIHFRSAVNAGQRMGREIGRHVYQNLLRPQDSANKHVR
jgi:hypothetical protein